MKPKAKAFDRVHGSRFTMVRGRQKDPGSLPRLDLIQSPRFKLILLCLLASSANLVCTGWAAPEELPSQADLDFFETRIRPVLAKQCHGCHSRKADKVKAGFLLDTRPGIRKGGESGRDAIIPGDVEGSQLIEAIRYGNKKLQMPPKGRLPDATIADFEKWVSRGAPDPREGASLLPHGIPGKNHWAWKKPRRHDLPKVKNEQWPRDPLDYFVLSKLEAEEMKPSPDADRRTLLRRSTLELTGLPPTLEEIAAFLADPRPVQDAFASVVDGLLASDGFGIRWGRHWLDVARYGESSGYSRNMLYPYAWRYRNYVIDSFNSDKPIDRFFKEQIAGDLLQSEDWRRREEQIIGTGFLALGPKTFNEKNPLLFQLNVADDQIDATCRAFLALTANCARCHDHKYDPIPTKDYYALAGIFLSSRNLAGSETNVRNEHAAAYPLGENGWERLRMIDKAKAVAEETQANYMTLVKRRDELRTSLQNAGIDWKKNPSPEYADAEEKVQAQKRVVKEAKGSIPEALEFAMAVMEGMKAEEAEAFARELEMDKALIAKMKKTLTGKRAKDPIPDQPRIKDSPVYDKGSHEAPLEKSPRGSLGFFGYQNREIGEKESGRLQLAEWIVDNRNPMTARVFANRVWHHLFGRGLVKTVDNFGTLGTSPSHPELLDSLALDFMASGWSLKKLVRRLVLSRTYRQGSKNHPERDRRDPDNVMLWRYKPQLMEGEVIRDSILAVGGMLDTSRPKGSQVLEISKQQALGRQREIGRRDYYKKDVNWGVPRRSAYLPMARGVLPDVLAVFDAPDPNLVVGARKLTIVPTQALYLMNGKMVIDASAATAKRVCAMRKEERPPYAYELILGRHPNEQELAETSAFLEKSGDSVKTWAQLCQALCCSGEFRTLY